MVLLAFLVGLALSLAALAYVVVRGFVLYRQAKRTSGAISGPLAAFEAKTAEIDRHLDAFDRSSKELEVAVARLKRSQAQLQVLQDSVERAQARVHWLRVFLPAR
jgi:exonuclease VII small subunit